MKYCNLLSKLHYYSTNVTCNPDIVNCPGCGSAKLAHHLCPNCYSQISRGFKREAREIEAAKKAGTPHSNVKPNRSVKDIVTTAE